jgi:hypothetical protein
LSLSSVDRRRSEAQHDGDGTPWGFILCECSDDDWEPQSLEFYQTIFTAAGRGTP